MRRVVALVLFVCLLAAGCSFQQKPLEETCWAMDTYMSFKLWGKDAREGMNAIQQLLSEMEATWSVADDTSLLSRLNRGEAVASKDQQRFLDAVMKLSERTEGAFDPQLNSVIALWGFLSDNYRVPDQAEIRTALKDKQWNLGAVVKGYAGQQAAALLEDLNVDRAVLNLGGNVQTYGEKADGSPWQIAIQNPQGGDYVGIVSVFGTASVITSGDYQRYFEEDGIRYHHILDPATGYPSDSDLCSVTVICRDGMTADALSTALYVLGLEAAAELWRQSDDFEAVFILSTGDIYATEGAALSGCEYEVIYRED